MNDNWIMIKIRICATNNTIKHVKRQPTIWDKISVNPISDKEFVYRTLTT